MSALLWFAARLRRFGRSPVQYRGKNDLASDSLEVERRLLIARLGQDIARHLLYYPPDVGKGALHAAEWLLTGQVGLALNAPDPAVEEYHESPLMRPRDERVVMRISWALALLSACATGLWYLVSGRA